MTITTLTMNPAVDVSATGPELARRRVVERLFDRVRGRDGAA